MTGLAVEEWWDEGEGGEGWPGVGLAVMEGVSGGGGPLVRRAPDGAGGVAVMARQSWREYGAALQRGPKPQRCSCSR